jgi:hypothetical protein
MLHTLPKGFMRIRHYGILANRSKKINVPISRKLLGLSADLTEVVKESIEAMMLRITGQDIGRCPYCKNGRLIKIGRIADGTAPGAYKVLYPP